MITLNKLVQNPSIRGKATQGFEPIEKIVIGKVSYLLWIPFKIYKIAKSNNIQILFNVSAMEGILPHFSTLRNNGNKYALTTAYENLLEIKRIIRKDIAKIEPIIKLKKSAFLKSNFLQKNKDKGIEWLQLMLDLEVPLSDGSKPMSFEDIEKSRESVWITSLKKDSIKGMQDTLTKSWIKLNKQLQNKRGYLSSILIEVMALSKDGWKLSIKDKKEIQAKIDNQFNLN